jgi:hypothetical protein
MSCDEPIVAGRGLDMNHVWITRLRANLPPAMVSTDLKLEVAPDQKGVTNVHRIDSAPCRRHKRRSVSPTAR